jgi:hypothetical protein
MATERQIQDSRRNLALSNGPDMPQRKTNSSTNAITHVPWAPQRRPVTPTQISRHPTAISRQPPRAENRKIDKTNPIPFPEQTRVTIKKTKDLGEKSGKIGTRLSSEAIASRNRHSPGKNR